MTYHGAHHECTTELHSPTTELSATVTADTPSGVTVTIECDHCDFTADFRIVPEGTRSTVCDDCIAYANAMRRAIHYADRNGHECTEFRAPCATCGEPSIIETDHCLRCSADRRVVA